MDIGTKILDFKPNREFINPNFDGYKLSLQNIVTSKKQFDTSVHRAIPNSSQYGYLHAKLFNTHNHLIGQSLSDNDFVYFVDDNWNIQKVIYDPSATNEIELIKVFEIPKSKSHEKGDFNVSLTFVDSQAIFSDGVGSLYIAEINNNEWKLIFSEEVLGSNKEFLIKDVKIKEDKLHCLLYSISTGCNDRFLNVLNLITLSKNDGVWNQTGIKELTAGGDLHYAFIESSCMAIYIASEKSFKFTLDSDHPVETEIENLTVKEEKMENPPLGTSFSSQPVEECDFEGDKYTIFERLSCTSHEITHRYNIGTHKIILAKVTECEPAIALRHDVDAYLWQPVYENEDFSLKHIGTLNAFGYVEASKQQKKFTECAPDLSYSVICESNRHVFIYRQKKSVESGELRNRVSGRGVGFIAQQQVINIPDEIIGIYASNYNLFLLTSNTIFILRM